MGSKKPTKFEEKRVYRYKPLLYEALELTTLIIAKCWNPRIENPYYAPVEGEQKKVHRRLTHTTKMIHPRVKSHARGQNNESRALK